MENKEPRVKIFYVPKGKDDIGWQISGENLEEAITDAKRMQQEYAVVTQNEIQTVDNQVNANQGLDFGTERFCKKCNSPMKLVPAGISKKTGRPYKAFWACENKQCGNTEN